MISSKNDGAMAVEFFKEAMDGSNPWPLQSSKHGETMTSKPKLIGGLENVVFYHMLKIVIPIGFRIFQRE